MTANWIFVNAALLDGWVAAGRVDVVMGAMTVRGTGGSPASLARST